MKQKILISAGDLAGINPLTITKTAMQYPDTDFRILISRDTWHSVAEKLRIECPDNLILSDYGELYNVTPGKPDDTSYKAAALSLAEAAETMKKDNSYSALITLPLSKYGTSRFIEGFAGHTEYLARYFKSKVAMLLYSEKLAVCPLTTHISIGDVQKSVTPAVLEDTLGILKSFSRRYLNKSPLFTLLCFNPHCSDNGIMGDSDSGLMKMTEKLSSKFNIRGPMPADSAFSEDIMNSTDIYIGMYHDQVLIPFKMISFDTGINITAGLPFLRVSPDHGPAYDAVKNPEKVSSESLATCVKFIINSI